MKPINFKLNMYYKMPRHDFTDPSLYIDLKIHSELL